MFRLTYRACDFCGKEVAHTGSLKVKELRPDDDGFVKWRRVDICAECAKKLREGISKEIK